MRKIKKIFRFLFLVLVIGLFTFTLSSCEKPNNPTPDNPVVEDVKPTSIEISGQKDEIEIGEDFTITVKVLPDDATNKNVTYSSSDNNIATVTNGKVTGVSSGKVTITVSAAADASIKNSIEVNVKEKEPEVQIDISKVKFYDGVYSYDGKEHSLSVNPMSIPKGVVVEYVGNGQTEIGTYTVKAILKDAKGTVLAEISATLTITKQKKNVNNVKFDSQEFEWKKGQTYEVTAKNIPDGVKAVYEKNTLTDIGKVEATCKLYDEYDNELLKTLTATLTVKYKVIYNEEVFASSDNIYNGNEFALLVNENKISNFKNVVYQNNKATECGTYLASAIVETNDGKKVEYRAVLNIEHPFDQDFRDYTDRMFVYFLEGDQSTLNLFMIDYEAYGFEHQDATWYAYEKYTDEDHESDLEEIARLKEEFAQFNRDNLNSYQKVDYDKINQEIQYLDFMISNPEYILMRQSYIDQFGGYAGDIPSTMEAYQVRTKQDIEDIISYIDSVDEAFASYVDYALDRANAGYPLTNFTINNMIEYLDGVSHRIPSEDYDGSPYYLIAILENKIKDSKVLLGLSDIEINAYIARLDDAFADFIQAHIDLANELADKCLNLANENQSHYLASYGEKGKTLYELLLRNRLGITMPMEEYIEFLETVMKKYMTAYSSYSLSADAKSISNGEVKVLDTDDPLEILDYLRNVFAKTLVPDLKNTPVIGVAYMDKTVTANTTTLAYYMKSALDSTDKEFIHLNGDALGEDYLETIKTLAHEGYPGHLFAYVYSKENENLSNFVRVATNTGHGEGWAKYVECALCDFLAKEKGGVWVNAMNNSKFWDLYVYLLYTRIDVGIGYQGWDVKDVAKYCKNQNLNVDENSARDILLDLIEMPGQYAAYGYGQALFYEMHDEAKSLLGDAYNEVEFNEMLLGHGWIALGDLEELYEDYMTQKCFLYGVEFNK